MNHAMTCPPLVPAGVKPYYLDEKAGIAIINADCRNILPLLEPGSFDLVLTDPPYSEKTHLGARTTNDYGPKGGLPLVDFASCEASYIQDILGLCHPRRWCLAFIDWRHALALEQSPPAGLQFIRLGVWTKLNPMPQLTADRPSTGWETIAILHPPGAKRWNGGSGPAVWMHGTSRWGYFGPSNHPTEKPIGLMCKLIAQFSDQRETILDPFMGSGTTLVAAKMLHRRCLGIEIEERYAEIAAQRLAQEVLPL